MMNPEAIGNEIRKIRINKGITQPEIAKRAGIAQGRVSMVENGKYPNMDEPGLRDILSVLGVTYNEVMTKVFEAEEKGTLLDNVYKKVCEIHDAIFVGNGFVKEYRFAVPKGLKDALPLPIEFTPYLAVELKEKVREYERGDTLFFLEKTDDDEDPDDDEIIVIQNKGEKPVVLTVRDYNNLKDKPEILGFATHALKKVL